MPHLVRFDAPHWLALFAGLLLVGALGCFAAAAAAQNRLHTQLVGAGHT